MQTQIIPDGSSALAEAEKALRACVHCGFCNAVCPTYQVLGDEADGPRGRIYLIKELLEERISPAEARPHLDRCLTCRACEALCPSEVPYGRLLETGRARVEPQRRWTQRLSRTAIQTLFPGRRRVAALWTLGRQFAGVLPGRLRRILGPAANPAGASVKEGRRALLFAGCVQSAARPGINEAATRVLGHLGWEVLPDPGGCCGALDQHLADAQTAKMRMRHNIDAWWPLIEAGLECIVVTASGCAVTLREYAEHLKDDTIYAERARAVAMRVRDISECVPLAALQQVSLQADTCRYALHRPCTLEFPVRLGPGLSTLLVGAGFDLVPEHADLACCGSSGSYSLLQPQMADLLRQRKLAALTRAAPHAILTANIGCLLHLQAATPLPVLHWIEALARRLPD